MITNLILPILGSVTFIYIAVCAWLVFRSAPYDPLAEENADEERSARRKRR